MRHRAAASASRGSVRNAGIHPSGALDAINRNYVLCTRDQAIPPALQRRMIAENACADVVELDTDHTPHLSMTSEFAQALHRFAAHSFR